MKTPSSEKPNTRSFGLDCANHNWDHCDIIIALDDERLFPIVPATVYNTTQSKSFWVTIPYDYNRKRYFKNPIPGVCYSRKEGQQEIRSMLLEHDFDITLVDLKEAYPDLEPLQSY